MDRDDVGCWGIWAIIFGNALSDAYIWSWPFVKSEMVKRRKNKESGLKFKSKICLIGLNRKDTF